MISDIINKFLEVISWLISFLHYFESIKFHDIIHDIFFYDIMLNITIFFTKYVSCTTTLWFYPWYHRKNHEKLLWYQELLILIVLFIHFCLWYGVKMASGIKNFWYHSPMISPFSLISRHLCCKLVLVGGATGQELHLLLPRCHQRTGDWCPAELQQTWSST